jgi:CheY-like chemotaxis protein
MRILYIDDDVEDGEIFSEAVRYLGDDIECVIATNGNQALQAFVPPCPNFVFLDLRLPMMNGPEILIAFRERECFKETKVIIYSTIIDETEMQRCKQLGAHDCIQKSGNFKDLVNSLRKILL